LKDASKTAIMDIFEIKNIEDGTKLHDSIRLLFSKSTIPPKFICPICNKVMTNPVIALDTKNYCRVCIQDYFDKHQNSPEGKPLAIQNTISLFANHPLEQEISHFFRIYPDLKFCTEECDVLKAPLKDEIDPSKDGHFEETQAEGRLAGNGNQTPQ